MHFFTSGHTKQDFLSGSGYTDLRLQIKMLPNMVTQFSLSIDLVKFYGLEANLSCGRSGLLVISKVHDDKQVARCNCNFNKCSLDHWALQNFEIL
jgi:hypothetical protein